MITSDFNVSITELQAEVLDNYTQGRTRSQYAVAREALYDNYLFNEEWVSNIKEFWEAMGNPETITLYRGWKKGLDVENMEHTSWTYDKNVAIWHSCLFNGEGTVCSITLTKRDLLDVFIWACSDFESEVMVSDQELYIDDLSPTFEDVVMTENKSLKQWIERQ